MENKVKYVSIIRNILWQRKNDPRIVNSITKTEETTDFLKFIRRLTNPKITVTDEGRAYIEEWAKFFESRDRELAAKLRKI